MSGGNIWKSIFVMDEINVEQAEELVKNTIIYVSVGYQRIQRPVCRRISCAGLEEEWIFS
jgi:hypothetical protein